ncbi:SDR family NAD(P)-dependent oxidoreductase [Streptomyces oceani]|uniref:3-oxoacyl-ACP reductase n=1 Tax=Streptomyces oceani TaxID=1075402 RepID=A0A1E7JWP2_9ACTN|nr:SDR family oxidoreductase [Streptomyces oceani]OEU96052.1 3-oxoacyl-ACP reductase [Streptomyces oceani]
MSRNILVTGGGTGIGRAVAQHFAEQGDTVFATGRRPEPLAELASKRVGDIRTRPCDHTDPAAVNGLLGELPGTLHVLVNNAGGNTGFDADGKTDLASYVRDFRANLDANLVSAALTTHALDERLATGGAIVHIGSIAADKGAGSYGAAKAGLASWNLELADRLGPRDITANVVSPGYITDTEFFRDHLTDARRENLVAATSLGRAGLPDDIAESVGFLASPAARHITGQVLNVNGGERKTR